MAIVFVGAGSPTTGTGTTATVAVPSASSGDLLVMQLSLRASVATFVPPVGWTLVATADDPFAGFPCTTTVWRRVADASEPGTYAWSWTGSQQYRAVMVAYSGVDTTAPEDVSATIATRTATPTTYIPSITTVTAGAWMVACFGTRTLSVIGAPAEMEERINSGASAVTVLTADEERAVAGVTGTRSVTGNGSTWAAVTLALRPASAKGLPVIERWHNTMFLR